jgi:hypothetical protein
MMDDLKQITVDEDEDAHLKFLIFSDRAEDCSVYFVMLL